MHPRVRDGSQITTLGEAWREFAGKRGPWVIAVAVLTVLAARLALARPAGATPARRRSFSWLTRSANGRLLAVPAAAGVGAAAVALLTTPLGAGPLATMLLSGYLLVGVYEWTHFLIHTAHQPRSRYFRSIRRNHRLHHYKNEHFWHGITNTVSDRALGTYRDPAQVPRSPTARTLGRDAV